MRITLLSATIFFILVSSRVFCDVHEPIVSMGQDNLSNFSFVCEDGSSGVITLYQAVSKPICGSKSGIQKVVGNFWAHTGLVNNDFKVWIENHELRVELNAQKGLPPFRFSKVEYISTKATLYFEGDVNGNGQVWKWTAPFTKSFSEIQNGQVLIVRDGTLVGTAGLYGYRQ